MLSVVAYPYVVPNPAWLKLASLCWDDVYRITAPGVPGDPEEIHELNEKLGGFLKSLYAYRFDQPALTETFGNWLTAFSTSEPQDDEPFEMFRDKFNMKIYELLLGHGAFVPGPEKFDEITAPWWDHEYYLGRTGEYVRRPMRDVRPTSGTAAAAKARWRRYLDESERRKKAGDHNGAEEYKHKADNLYERSKKSLRIPLPTIYVKKAIALHYLSLIAATAAESLQADLFAESESYARTSVRGYGADLSTAVLESFVPKNLASLEPARLAEFRANTAAKRLMFQKAIQDVVAEFAGLSAEEQTKTITNRLVDIAKERIAQTQEAYRVAKLEYITKTIGVTLTPPALAASVASMLHIGIFAPAGIASAVTLCAAQLLISREKANLEKQKSPWSYVLSLGSLT